MAVLLARSCHIRRMSSPNRWMPLTNNSTSASVQEAIASASSSSWSRVARAAVAFWKLYPLAWITRRATLSALLAPGERQLVTGTVHWLFPSYTRTDNVPDSTPEELLLLPFIADAAIGTTSSTQHNRQDPPSWLLPAPGIRMTNTEPTAGARRLRRASQSASNTSISSVVAFLDRLLVVEGTMVLSCVCDHWIPALLAAVTCGLVEDNCGTNA